MLPSPSMMLINYRFVIPLLLCCLPFLHYAVDAQYIGTTAASTFDGLVNGMLRINNSLFVYGGFSNVTSTLSTRALTFYNFSNQQ
jgi:hypothetical protein